MSVQWDAPPYVNSSLTGILAAPMIIPIEDCLSKGEHPKVCTPLLSTARATLSSKNPHFFQEGGGAPLEGCASCKRSHGKD